MSQQSSGFFQNIYQAVSSIPRGQVATYGQIASLCGHPRAARMVGWALHLLAFDSPVPWQRVINREGRISTTCYEHPRNLQKELLEREGVRVTEKDENYFVDLDTYWWRPDRFK